MRILVTGGAGFIGHHLVHAILSRTNHSVVTLDRLDCSGTLERLKSVLSENADWKERLTYVWHDLRAPLNDHVENKMGPVDVVFHLAAGSHVDRSIDDPMSFVMDNVVGTGNILEYARGLHAKEQLKMFVYFGTDEIFGPAGPGVFYKEDDRYRSGNPYSATKAGAEELAIAYENTYKMPIIATHTMNVFGIRQHPEKFIPLIIKRVMSGEKLWIHEDKTCTQAGSRHYISATDVADAMLFLLENGRAGEKYNIVGNEETDNLELSEMIADIIGRPLNYEMVDFHSSRPGHDLRYALCGEKMKSLGWIPRKDLRERISEVVHWTLEHPAWIHDGGE